MPKYRYDPGEPYEPPSHRRRRQRYDAADDGWAAADEDDLDDDGVEIEDLAPGYVDHEQDGRRYDDDGSDWTPPPYSRRRARDYPADRRSRYDREPRGGRKPRAESRSRYGHRSPYGDNRTYHRDRASRGEYGEYHDERRYGEYPAKRKRESDRTDYPADYGLLGGMQGIPFWQILLVVSLAVFALFAAALACASILFLL